MNMKMNIEHGGITDRGKPRYS